MTLDNNSNIDNDYHIDGDDNNNCNSIIGKSGGSISSNDLWDQKIKQDNDNKCDDVGNNVKISVLNQLHPNIQEQLSNHIWEIISYNPLRFLVAHSEYKQILYAIIKEEDKRIKDLTYTNDLEKYGSKVIVPSLHFSRIVIGAIPAEVILNKNPLGFFEHKYTIRFITQTNESFTIGPKTIEEIVTYLKDRSYIYLTTKATEVLSIVIIAFEKSRRLVVKNEIDTPGFYLVDGKIRYSKKMKNNHKPDNDKIIKCCELLDLIYNKSKRKDAFATVIKWSIIAPFNYLLKQLDRRWIRWIHLYGWSNTGKTTLGTLACCVWNNIGIYEDENYGLPFTAIDTKARLGESLSKSTYPQVVDEVGPLSDEKNKELVEMIKTCITEKLSRKKFVNKTEYAYIPSLSCCILTSNNMPPFDTGYRRRTLLINFGEKDQYSESEIKDFNKLFNERIKNELNILGDFTINYLLENQEILFNNKKDWQEISELVLEQMYKTVGREPPVWIKDFIDYRIEDISIKEDTELLFRNYLVNKINDTFSRHYKSIESTGAMTTMMNSQDNNNSNFTIFNRLDFCLEHKLIPFLNLVKRDKDFDDELLIVITSDILHEIKTKIPHISSLREVAGLIDGFEYGQKKIYKNTNKNLRVAYGSKKQLLDFLTLD
ncbi:MAG: hypothetical protein MRJ93_11605 [Nitrososphaeraceae archaeon]|nr:hypothetical protein [Nitrososphaeraceae archaeon]